MHAAARVFRRRALFGQLPAPRHFSVCLTRQSELLRDTTKPDRKLPAQPARTRFAPSPTGYLHLGSLRTALFNYLLAKATGGQFLLRIEDTDQKRTIPDAEDRLCRDLQWAGLPWDEGGPYGPYKQSERLPLYKEQADKLLESGHAYRCFCSAERLNELAEQRHKLGLPTHYDRHCTHLSKAESDERAHRNEPHVIRLLSPDRNPEFYDLVYGKIKSREPSAKAQFHPAYEDPVLIKSDGFPTYHLANVVDDHFMKITHVIRGAEWMSSTPKHVAMYNAFGWEPPMFAHVGLLMDKNRQKLSKRKMDIDVSAFKDKMGIFPETLTNFLALLGWSHRLRSDVMSPNELVANFDLNFTTGDTVVTMDKLWFLQRAHAERYIQYGNPWFDTMVTSVLESAQAHFGSETSLDQMSFQPDYVSALIRADAGNFTNGSEFFERNIYFFSTPTESALRESIRPWTLAKMPDPLAQEPQNKKLVSVGGKLKDIPEDEWTSESIRTVVNAAVKEEAERTAAHLASDDLKLTAAALKSWSALIHRFLRWAITAGKSGPDGAATMALIGRDETVRRLELAFKILNK